MLKKGASAFFGTNLVAILVSQGMDTVVLCGATTSGCIRATAIDLMQNGFPAVVPRECVGDRAARRTRRTSSTSRRSTATSFLCEDAHDYLRPMPAAAVASA